LQKEILPMVYLYFPRNCLSQLCPLFLLLTLQKKIIPVPIFWVGLWRSYEFSPLLRSLGRRSSRTSLIPEVAPEALISNDSKEIWKEWKGKYKRDICILLEILGTIYLGRYGVWAHFQHEWTKSPRIPFINSISTINSKNDYF